MKGWSRGGGVGVEGARARAARAGPADRLAAAGRALGAAVGDARELSPESREHRRGLGYLD